MSTCCSYAPCVEEFEAARRVAANGLLEFPGVSRWQPMDEEDTTEYLVGEFTVSEASSLIVALVELPRMGGDTTSRAFWELSGRAARPGVLGDGWRLCWATPGRWHSVTSSSLRRRTAPCRARRLPTASFLTSGPMTRIRCGFGPRGGSQSRAAPVRPARPGWSTRWLLRCLLGGRDPLDDQTATDTWRGRRRTLYACHGDQRPDPADNRWSRDPDRRGQICNPTIPTGVSRRTAAVAL